MGQRTQRANVASPNDAIRDLSRAGIAQSTTTAQCTASITRSPRPTGSPGVAITTDALAQVIVWVDGEVLVELEAPPYETLWQLVPSVHQFQVRGIDAHGRSLYDRGRRPQLR